MAATNDELLKRLANIWLGQVRKNKVIKRLSEHLQISCVFKARGIQRNFGRKRQPALFGFASFRMFRRFSSSFASIFARFFSLCLA